MTTDAPAGTLPTTATKRLVSLDAFRGFIMIWIVGGESLAHALGKLSGKDTGILATVSRQLHHVKWEGCRFYDLIFPTFIFIVGISIVYSLSKIVSLDDKKTAVTRVIRRGLLLWFIGIIYYGGWSKGIYDPDHNQGIRLLGVLQRIGICYLFTSLLFLFLPLRGLIASFVTLLVGYWALLTFVPVPQLSEVSFEEGKNFTNWFDSQYLPFFKWNKTHDPEGILSTLPAIATCLLGVFAGLLLKHPSLSGIKKCLLLAGTGIGTIVLGHLWGLQFPVIKNLWTSSFVLVAGGWSLLFLATFYAIIDLKGWQSWAAPFVWIGVNPITIYLLASLISFNNLSTRLLGGPISEWANNITLGLGVTIIACGEILISIFICRYLFRKKLFIRI